MANHEIVPASAFTKGTAERKKSATSFSLPGFASSGTYSANFFIASSPVLPRPSRLKTGTHTGNEEAMDGVPCRIAITGSTLRYPDVGLPHICLTRTDPSDLEFHPLERYR